VVPTGLFVLESLYPGLRPGLSSAVPPGLFSRSNGKSRRLFGPVYSHSLRHGCLPVPFVESFAQPLPGTKALGSDVVPNVGSAYPENHVFRDVGGVVADPLQVTSDHQRMERLRSVMRLLFDQVGKSEKSSVV
jgi:hypothetical protein